jgi:hypothetical protein
MSSTVVYLAYQRDQRTPHAFNKGLFGLRRILNPACLSADTIRRVHNNQNTTTKNHTHLLYRSLLFLHTTYNTMADQDEVTVHLTVTANQAAPRIPLVVAKTDTAAALFGKVSATTNIPRASLKLIFRGRLIPDDASKQAVTEFKMEEGSVLHCMGKPTNGAATSAGGTAASASTGTSAAMPVPAAASASAAAAAGSTFTFQPSAAAAASTPAMPPADPLAAALASLRGSNSAADYSTAVTTLEKVLSNIISHPMEDKYRKVKKQNPAFQRRLGGLAAGDAAMKAAGFVSQTTTDGEEVYMMEASAEAWPSLLRTKAAVDAAAREAKAAANQSSAPPQPAGGMGGGMPGMPAGGGMPGMGGGMPQGMPAGMGGQDMQSAVANLMADPNALQSMMQVRFSPLGYSTLLYNIRIALLCCHCLTLLTVIKIRRIPWSNKCYATILALPTTPSY